MEIGKKLHGFEVRAKTLVRELEIKSFTILVIIHYSQIQIKSKPKIL